MKQVKSLSHAQCEVECWPDRDPLAGVTVVIIHGPRCSRPPLSD